MATKAKATAKPAAKKGTKKAPTKRELIDPNGDKRLIRRDPKGRIKESDDLTRSLREDVKHPAKTKVKPGFGDKGDQPRKKGGAKKAAAKKPAAKK